MVLSDLPEAIINCSFRLNKNNSKQFFSMNLDLIEMKGFLECV